MRDLVEEIERVIRARVTVDPVFGLQGVKVAAVEIALLVVKGSTDD